MGADRDLDPVTDMLEARGVPPVDPEHRHVNLLLADILAKSIRDAAEVNRASLEAQRFPLGAEQIVRLIAGVAGEILDAGRRANDRRVNRDALAIRLGEMAGVPMTVGENTWGERHLAPIAGTAGPLVRDRDATGPQTLQSAARSDQSPEDDLPPSASPSSAPASRT